MMTRQHFELIAGVLGSYRRDLDEDRADDTIDADQWVELSMAHVELVARFVRALEPTNVAFDRVRFQQASEV